MDKYVNKIIGGGAGVRADPQVVVKKIQMLLDKLPEVEKASGTLNLKLKGQPMKTLRVNYQ